MLFGVPLGISWCGISDEGYLMPFPEYVDVGRSFKSTMDRRTYMKSFVYARICEPSSVGMMAASALEPSSVGNMDTSSVTKTSNLFLVPNSLLSFNLEGNSFMKIL